jgi:hypothetical protein
VTFVGWFGMLLGLSRMFFPEMVLRGVQNIAPSITFAEEMIACAVGVVLTFKGYSRRGE